MTIQIFGRPLEDGMTIKVEGVILSTIPPAPTEYIADPLSPIGTNKEEPSPHNKIVAECYKVYYKDDIEISRELVSSSSYRAIAGKTKIGCLDPITGAVYAVDPVTGVVAVPILPTPPIDTAVAVAGVPAA